MLCGKGDFMRLNPNNIKGSLNANYNFRNYNTLYHNRPPLGSPPAPGSSQGQRVNPLVVHHPNVAIKNAYLVDIDTTEQPNRLDFDYIPDQINDENAANYSSTNIIGRSAPLQGYQDSGPRTFSIELKFHASLQEAEVDHFHNSYGYDAVKARIDWLRSLTYPDYSETYAKPPHRVLFVIGTLIKSICIVDSINVTYRSPWNDNLLPMVAELTLPLKEVASVPWGVTEVRAGIDVGRT